LHLNTSYHPHTDGQTEFVNTCLETYLRFFESDMKNQWAQWLPLDEWWYNISYYTTTHMTPFEEVYRKKPLLVLSYMPNVLKVQEVEKYITVHEAIVRALKENLVMAQNHMKQPTYQGHSERQFSKGDQVFLHLQPYKKTSIKSKHCQKLAPKFYVPYIIIKQVEWVAY
jgi:hypothetical protein